MIALDTPRLRLEPVAAAVARAVLDGDHAAAGVTPSRGWPHADTYDALRPAAAADEPGTFLVVRRSDGLVIGDCGWHGGPDERGDAEIGYGLAAPARGEGYGTEAVAALAGWVERQPGVRRVVAETMADNLPSRRLLERLGFELTAVVEPHVWYAREADTGASR